MRPGNGETGSRQSRPTQNPDTRPPHHAVLFPHQELLFRCAIPRSEAAPDPAVEAALARAGMDWPNLIDQSVRHGIAGLVAARLGSFSDDPRVPCEITRCLRSIMEGNARRNRVMFQETAKFVSALQDAGVRSVVLKGVALAVTLYDDPLLPFPWRGEGPGGLRTFADIDILVDGENFEPAAKVADACGYERQGNDIDAGQMEVTYIARASEDILTPTVAPEYMPSLTPEILARDDRRIVIDIHRTLGRFAGGFVRDVDMEPFWDRLRPFTLPGGCECATLSPEAMLVHLCQHAGFHRFQRLVFPSDVSRLILVSGASMDWDRVEACADALGERKNLYRMLDFVRREFRVEAWANVQGCVGARHGEPPATHASPAPSTAQPPGTSPALSTSRYAFVPLQVADIFDSMRKDRLDLFWSQVSDLHWREFVVVCRQMVFPPVSYLRGVHRVRSRPGILLAYLYRPFHLAGHLAQVLWRRIVRKH